MKLLIMCEGPNELEIIKILLHHNCLRFTMEDLVNLMPYHARQLDKSTVIQNALALYQGEFKILRIGDALSEKLRIPVMYKDRVADVEKYCTKPELEMLLIIAENLDKEFEKVKSSVKPKNFAKSNIKCGRRKYDNSTRFYTDYFGDNVELLVNSIKNYKRKKGNHKKDELYLADLLK